MLRFAKLQPYYRQQESVLASFRTPGDNVFGSTILNAFPTNPKEERSEP